MKRLVFIIREDVCAANGKSVDAIDLLKVMNTYGTVVDYDTFVAAEKAEYQTAIDNLTKQVNDIKEQELTDDEICMINAYRTCKAETQKGLKAENLALVGQLSDNKDKLLAMIEQIRTIIDNKAE